MADIRLIERWLPIAEIGIESMRERTPMTPFPAPNRLHVWWARRPLVASRAAVLASLLPLDADRKAFLHAIGIHGDPLAAKARIAEATRKGERLGAGAYGYGRAFKHPPDEEVRDWLASEHEGATVLDPTAGGGSIAFEALRLGLAAQVNDLNTVAALIEMATAGWPTEFGGDITPVFAELGERFVGEVRERLVGVFPRNRETTRDQMATSTPAPSPVRTAPGWCRCPRTGAWRPVARAFGWCRSLAVGRRARGGCAGSRSSTRRNSSPRERWHGATRCARIQTAGGRSTGTRSRRRRKPDGWASSCTPSSTSSVFA